MFDQDVLFCSVSREEKRITSYFVINIPIRHSFQREIQASYFSNGHAARGRRCCQVHHRCIKIEEKLWFV